MMRPDAKVLVVDDYENVLSRHAGIFESPSQGFKDEYGDIVFHVEKARSKKGALDKLEEARQQGKTFDIILLDLEIPSTDHSEDASVEMGMAVLESVRWSDFTSVLILSRHANFVNARKVFKGGALDFLEVPQVQDAPIWIAAMSAWEQVWLQARYHELELRLEHLGWALEQSKDEVAREFSTLVAEKVGDMLDGVNHLAHLLNDRYVLRLDEDQEDPVVVSVVGIRDAAQSLLREGAQLRTRTSSAELRYGAVDLFEILEHVERKLRPALVFRHVRVVRQRECETEIQTFEEDLLAVLEEILFGSITAYPTERGDTPGSRPWGELRVTVKRDRKRGRMLVVVTDRAPAIEEALCNEVNKGGLLGRDEPRVWGLSLAQRLAHNMGAHIEAAPLPDDRGTSVVLVIPVSENGSNTDR